MANKSYQSKSVCEFAVDIAGTAIAPDSFTPPPAAEIDEGGGLIGGRFRVSGNRTPTKRDQPIGVGTKLTHAQANTLLPLFFGGTPDSGASFFSGYVKNPLFASPEAIENIVDVQCDFMKEAGKIKQYNDCYLAKLEVELSNADPVLFNFGFISTAAPTEPTDTIAAATAAAWASAADHALNINANAYFPDSIKWAFDYNLLFGFNGTLYPRVRGAGLFGVSGEITLTLNTDVWADLIAIQDTTSVIASLQSKVESGTYGFGFEATEIALTGPWPEISGDGEVTHTMQWRGYGSAATMCNGYTLAP